MCIKYPLRVIVLICVLLKWTIASDVRNFCVWTKVMSNSEVHYTFLTHDKTQPLPFLRLYHSVWSKENSLVNCAWNDESAVTENYLNLCRKREGNFTEHSADHHFDINMMLESNSPCTAFSPSTVVERVDRAGKRHVRSAEGDDIVGASVQNLHDDGDSSGEEKHRRVKRGFIVPGTLWCGSGNKAATYVDLGVFSNTDSCCREHDQCQDTILSFQSNYGVFNKNIFTMSHCDCDNKFRQCLQAAQDRISNVVGYTFFNVLQMNCFEFTHKLQCVKRNWFGMCLAEEMGLYAEVYSATMYNSTYLDSEEGDQPNASINSTVSTQVNLISDHERNIALDQVITSSSGPAIHATTPASSTTEPAIHTAPPAPSTTEPAIHTALPALSTTEEAIHTSPPALSPTEPAIHTALPALSTTEAAIHTSPPALSPTEPAIHTAPPAPSTTEAAIHTSPPALSPTEPAIHTAPPAPSTTEPAIHTALPALSTTEPAIHTALPALSTTEPAIHTALPAPSTTEPAIHTALTALSPTEPAIHTALPALSTTEPAIHTSPPALSTTEPAIHTAPPALSTTEPAIHTALPALSTTEPAIHTGLPASQTSAHSVVPTTPGADGSTPALNTLEGETASKPVDNQGMEKALPTQSLSVTHTTKPTSSNTPLRQGTPNRDESSFCEVYQDLDKCRVKIPPQQERYGFHNPEPRSLYHCNCTSRLFQRLGQQKQLNGLQSALLEHVSKSCFTLQPQHCTKQSSCTAVLVQPLLAQLEQPQPQSGGDVEEGRHLQVLMLQVRRPYIRRAKRKGRPVRLYKLCLRMTQPKQNKTRRPQRLQVHSRLPYRS